MNKIYTFLMIVYQNLNRTFLLHTLTVITECSHLYYNSVTKSIIWL